MTVKIGDLGINDRSVYIRPNGDQYCKLNESYHVKAVIKVTENKLNVLGDGEAETFDPNEEVRPLELSLKKEKI